MGLMEEPPPEADGRRKLILHSPLRPTEGKKQARVVFVFEREREIGRRVIKRYSKSNGTENGSYYSVADLCL